MRWQIKSGSTFLLLLFFFVLAGSVIKADGYSNPPKEVVEHRQYHFIQAVGLIHYFHPHEIVQEID